MDNHKKDRNHEDKDHAPFREESPDGTQFKENRLRENRVLVGIVILSLIVIAGFVLTWAYPRNAAQKPPVTPAPAPAPADPAGNSAEIITQRVTAIPGVEGAQVLILSRTALIALDVKSGIPTWEVRSIKKEASARAQGMAEVDEVLVTASPDLAAELRKILEGEEPLERLDDIYERIRDQQM